MKSAILSLLFYVLTVLLLTPSVMADSFTTTYAGIAGYQWLDFGLTIEKSRNAIESQPSFGLDGYRYATRKETELLIEAIVGGPITTFSSDPDQATTLENIAPPNWLTSFTTEKKGITHSIKGNYNFWELAFYYGQPEEATNGKTLYGHLCFYDYIISNEYGSLVYERCGASSFFDNPAEFDTDYTFSNIASLLVRTPLNEVPEPTTALLFFLGIAGIVTSKRKKCSLHN